MGVQETTADVAVLIVAYRSRDSIQRCLDAVAAQTLRPREVYLAENGSPPGQRIAADEAPDWVRFVLNEDNLGYAAANNRLAEMAGARWLALLNPDAFPHPTWLEELMAATARYPDTALFGSTQYAADCDGVLDGVGDAYHAVGLAYRGGYGRPVDLLPPEGEVFTACGAAALIRRDLFAALGGFDERYFCYGEDVDLGYRARLRGYRTIQVRDAAVDHQGYTSSGRRSEFATYYGVRNRFWVFVKNTPGWLLWLLAPAHILINFLLWLSAARFGQFRLYARAIKDGLKDWPRLMAARRQVQSTRTASPWQIARAMSWDPRRLLSLAPDVRPVE